MTSGYLLDTDIVSYRIRGAEPHLALKFRHTPSFTVFVSTVTVAELLYGVKGRPPGHQGRIDVELFLASANILVWDRTAAEAYADIRYYLIRSGRTIGELDMMIDAHALSAGLTLVTNNTRHFQRLAPPLRLENWTEA